ncbi:hypothetical protein PHYBOEH_001925 [Phytophthora boehmeriae]|uniref:Glycoside-hydrolase family GH114 TIM-barrel domain-containing protein n=1 Tax=Phytophthora boehmeriae TaxID=109152 RepID=A0A8T1WTB0_9STRA|nr:hypothetical protein PHYBOEH_001925 [Phytophthora boehmeriae]
MKLFLLAFASLLGCIDAWWKPAPGTSYQIQLSGTLDVNYDVEAYDIDLFDTPNATIAKLHQRGIKVICYFSAGTYEDWRTDKDRYTSDMIGSPLEEWEGESWVDIRSSALREIISDRMKVAKVKGCDGVDPDNVDGAFNDNGFDLTADDQLDFNKFLASTAHDLDLTVGLKNDLDQIEDLVPHFDFSVNEQCVQYDECDKLVPFVNQDKPVFGIEYSGDKATGCVTANSLNFDTLFKTLSLQSERYSCREMTDGSVLESKPSSASASGDNSTAELFPSGSTSTSESELASMGSEDQRSVGMTTKIPRNESSSSSEAVESEADPIATRTPGNCKRSHH